MKDMIKRNISKWLNEALFWILRITSSNLPEINSDNIFIIRFAHIGDFCVWLDSAKAFRELYPDKKITFLTYSYKNVVELAEATGYFDEIISFNTEGFNRIRALRQARRLCGDFIINANPSRTLLSDLFVLAVNVNYRVAQQSDFAEMPYKKVKRSDKIYNKIIPSAPQKMELIKNAEFIRGLGKMDFRAGVFELPCIVCDIQVPEEKYAVVFPDADADIQMWNYRNYAKVIKQLICEYKLKCLILGGEKYRYIGDSIVKLLNNSACINLMGQTTLSECIKLVRYAELVVSNDTGGAHIAAGVKTPCVVLAAGWNRGRFFPYKIEAKKEDDILPIDIIANVDCIGCGIENINRFNPECGIQGVPKCIALNTPEDILEQIKTILES